MRSDSHGLTPGRSYNLNQQSAQNKRRFDAVQQLLNSHSHSISLTARTLLSSLLSGLHWHIPQSPSQMTP